MQRLTKIGKIRPKNASEIGRSRIGIGFEKLDRDVFDPEKAYDKLAATGVKWARIQSGWARTERERGVYDFAWLDAIVENLLSRGVQPWICLCYGNGIYNKDAAEVFGAVGVPPLSSEEERAAWLAYVRAVVARYRGKVTHYEVWNEPDGKWCWRHGVSARELGVFTAATGRAIHETDPGAEVIGLVQCKPDLRYAADALDGTGMAENIDALSFHHYDASERAIPERVSSLRAVAERYKKGIKIIQGESGSQSRAGGNGALRDKLWTERAQMKQLVRHLVTDLACGVEFTSYFSCLDMIEALNGRTGDRSTYQDYGYFGVLRADFDENGFAVGTYSPKPSYYALQTLAAVFAEDPRVMNDAPVLFRPEAFPPLNTQDCARTELMTAFFERENGSQCFVYWKPENILTTDYCGAVSFDVVSGGGEVFLADLCSGDVFALPENMLERDGNFLRVRHAPVKDTPLALIAGDFCDWDRI